MRDLRQKVERWRRAFEKAGYLHRDELDELESHLVETFESLLSRGVSEEEAFSLAIRQMGDSGSLSREYEKTHVWNSNKLWRAFMIAPMVSPILLALDAVLPGFYVTLPIDMGTLIGGFPLPLLALTVGVFASYLVAALIWMPSVFFLKRRGWLHGGSLHLLGFLLAVTCFALLETAIYFGTTPRPAELVEFVASSLFLAGFMIPNIMVSVLVFWLMVRDRSQQSEPWEIERAIQD